MYKKLEMHHLDTAVVSLTFTFIQVITFSYLFMYLMVNYMFFQI